MNGSRPELGAAPRRLYSPASLWGTGIAMVLCLCGLIYIADGARCHREIFLEPEGEVSIERSCWWGLRREISAAKVINGEWHVKAPGAKNWRELDLWSDPGDYPDEPGPEFGPWGP